MREITGECRYNGDCEYRNSHSSEIDMKEDEIIKKAAKLRQQNEALMAQVEELREAMQSVWLPTAAARELIQEVLAKSPQQSLDSLRSKVEEETIINIKQIANEYLEGYEFDKLIAAIKNMPRKYKEK